MQWSTPQQPKYLATPAHHGGHHHHSHSTGNTHSGNRHNTNNNAQSSANTNSFNKTGGNQTNVHRASSPVHGNTNYTSHAMNDTPPTYSPRVPGSAGRRSATKPKEYETDPHRLAQRQKQIMYGENTPGYANFIKALERDPTLAQGCVPAKPSIVQKCSKRSWDGQVRKWRRALHMYDFVDFGNDAEESKRVQQALVEQTRNPVFRNRNPNGDEDAAPREVLANEYVRYTFDDMMALGESPLITQNIRLPESIAWLDKRVDLEDDIEDDDDFFINTASPSGKSPSRFSPMPSPVPSPARAVPTSPQHPQATRPAATPAPQQPNNPSISPPAATVTPLTPGKTPSPGVYPNSLSPLMARTYALPTTTAVPVSVQLPNGQTAIALVQMQQVQGVAAGGNGPIFFAPADPTHAAGHAQTFCWSPPAADHHRQPLFAQPPTPQQQQ